MHCFHSPKIIKQNELNFGIHQLGEASDGWVSARDFAFFLREGTIGKLYGADRTVWKVARLPDLKNSTWKLYLLQKTLYLQAPLLGWASLDAPTPNKSRSWNYRSRSK